MQAIADPYFHGLANIDKEPSTEPISKMEFDFERRKATKDDIRELIYREVCSNSSLQLYLNFFHHHSYNAINLSGVWLTDIRVPSSNA